MPTNLIINGTFDGGNTGWSGNDLETNYRETAYLGNGSQNRVAELDGRSNQTTVMQQSFFVSDPSSTELTFDTALRNASNPSAGQEGFTVEILDSSNNVIASSTVLPTSNSFVGTSLPVNFPSAGTYTVRFTELGPDDSLGAIIDNVSLMICFLGVTRVETLKGLKPARDIKVGDVLLTENGPRPVRWVGKRTLTSQDLVENPKLHPVKIEAGALGSDLPKADIWVSRQHRMLVQSQICQRMFEQDRALVAACRMTALPGIYEDKTLSEVEYVHFLFDQHEIVFAEGAPSESLLLAEETLKSVGPDARKEIEELFPELNGAKQHVAPAAFIPSNKRQTRLVERLSVNGKTALGNYSESAGRAAALVA